MIYKPYENKTDIMEKYNIISITTFKSVQLPINKKCLLVFDIDETILKYEGISKQWWKDKFNTYYDIHKNYDIADNLCTTDWKKNIQEKIPEHTDKDEFFKLVDRVNKINTSIIIVTARDEQIKDITFEHLHHLGIINFDVYFSDSCNKGIKIEEIINKNNEYYDHVILIDDMDYNLIDTREHFGNSAILYKFDHK